MNQSIFPSLPLPFADERGIIQMLIDHQIGSILYITSYKGAIRANHYHKQDYHYCYLVYGSMEYYERPVGNTDAPEKVLIKSGQLFYTPPMVEHAMKFLEDSAFFVFSKLPRHQYDYENDLIRVKLIEEVV